MLARIDEASADTAAVEARIEELIVPFAQAVERLDEITGVGITAAHVMIAEVGVDLTRFPTAAAVFVGPVRPRGEGVGWEEQGPRLLPGTATAIWPESWARPP